jgi:hypothetical protein
VLLTVRTCAGRGEGMGRVWRAAESWAESAGAAAVCWPASVLAGGHAAVETAIADGSATRSNRTAARHFTAVILHEM